MAKVVPFRARKRKRKGARKSAPPTGLTGEELAARIRKLALDGDWVLSDHARDEMNMPDRDVSMREVLECIQKGNGSGAPQLDEFGEWRLFMVRKVAGRRIKVRVAAGAAMLTIVTVYPPQ